MTIDAFDAWLAEIGEGADDAVVVVDLIGQGQAATQIGARHIGQFDAWRIVGDDREIEAPEHCAGMLNGQLRIAAENEMMLMRIGRRRGLGGGIILLRRLFRFGCRGDFRRIVETARRLKVDKAAGTADRYRRADRHGNLFGVVDVRAIRRELQEHGRLASIGRRIDPGIDTIADLLPACATPIESAGDARIFFRAGDEGAGDQRHKHTGAQRITIEIDHARRWQSGAQLADIARHSLQMNAPQRLRRGIGSHIGERVIEA